MKISEKKVILKTGQSVLLRSPEAGDSQLALEHLRRVFRDHYKNFNRSADYWNSVTVEEEAKIITDVLEAPNKFMISVFDGNKIVAFLGIMNNGNHTFQKYSAHLGIGIETEFQNSGLGTEMIKHCFDEARKAGIHSIQLEVRTFNQAAIGLYEKLGFRRVGEMKEVAYIDGQFYDEYIYQKLLAVNS